MKVAIFAVLNAAQLDYLRQLAERESIECQFIVEGDESEITVGRRETSTPLTGTHLEAAAHATGKSVMEVAQLASQLRITTVEQALAHTEIPRAVKSALEAYL